MLGHLFSLLGRSFAAIPPTLGSNWFGLLFAVVVVLIGEGLGFYFFGWEAMMVNLKKVTGIGFAALGVGYTLVFAWCVVVTTFQDHMQLTSRLGVLQNIAAADMAHEAVEVGKARDECAELRGANRVLESQNKDQQGSINNCQTEAIKRIVPELENHGSWEVSGAGNEHSKFYVYTTNRTIPMTAIVLRCDRDVTNVDAFIMGNPARFFPRYTVTGEHRYTFSTPAEWSPIDPIQISLSFTGEVPNCTLQRNDK